MDSPGSLRGTVIRDCMTLRCGRRSVVSAAVPDLSHVVGCPPVQTPSHKRLTFSATTGWAHANYVAARISDPHWADPIPAHRPMLVGRPDGFSSVMRVIVSLFPDGDGPLLHRWLAFNDYGRVGWTVPTAMKLVPRRSFKASPRTGTDGIRRWVPPCCRTPSCVLSYFLWEPAQATADNMPMASAFDRAARRL